ncbi:MAG: ABC-type transport auxiliary lipoprotein family protein [Zoogloeaceae bacterium]|jgi:cholesterol transport system auxiliary component|nr:ABC-type transport auxiliary lipoprotein family protein [Zoogloeaceae bacterium]
MKTRNLLLSLFAGFFLAACASLFPPPVPSVTLFDLGADSLPESGFDASRRAWLFELRAVPGLQSPAMRYRLEYAAPAGSAQVFAYAESQWSNPPAEILRRRLEGALSWPAGTEDRCELFLHLQRFEQVFPAPDESYGILSLKARLWNRGKNRLEDEAQFTQKIPAPTPDAAGGVTALAEGAKRLAQDLRQWRETGRDKQKACWL